MAPRQGQSARQSQTRLGHAPSRRSASQGLDVLTREGSLPLRYFPEIHKQNGCQTCVYSFLFYSDISLSTIEYNDISLIVKGEDSLLIIVRLFACIGKEGMIDLVEDSKQLNAVVSPVFESTRDEQAWNIYVERKRIVSDEPEISHKRTIVQVYHRTGDRFAGRRVVTIRGGTGTFF